MAGATILQIVPRLDTGGAELATVEIAQAIVEAGGRALVLTEGGRMGETIARAGGEVVPFPAAAKNPATILANAFRIARLVADQGVDLVHARSRAPAWSALLAARKSVVPFVTTYHGAYGGTNAIKNLYNSVMARGDVVIANSNYTAELIAKRHATPSDRVRVIHRGVDLARFDLQAVSDQRVAKLKRDWGVSDNDKIVLHAARLTGWKGQLVVIEAAARLAREGKLGGAAIVMAGDTQGRSQYAEELRASIEWHGLQDRARLVGHCSDMPAAYAAAHVTLVPSTEPEAFGRASAEAQAMGSPVIASELGASPETVLVDEGVRTGWLVRPGDADALGQAIAVALALTPEQRKALAAHARDHARRMFSLEAMRLATLEVYDRLLGTQLAANLRRKSPRPTTGAA